MDNNKKFCCEVNQYFNSIRNTNRVDYVLNSNDTEHIIFYVYEFSNANMITKYRTKLIGKWIKEHLNSFIIKYDIRVPIVFILSPFSNIYYDMKSGINVTI